MTFILCKIFIENLLEYPQCFLHYVQVFQTLEVSPLFSTCWQLNVLNVEVFQPPRLVRLNFWQYTHLSLDCSWFVLEYSGIYQRDFRWFRQRQRRREREWLTAIELIRNTHTAGHRVAALWRLSWAKLFWATDGKAALVCFVTEISFGRKLIHNKVEKWLPFCLRRSKTCTVHDLGKLFSPFLS